MSEMFHEEKEPSPEMIGSGVHAFSFSVPKLVFLQRGPSVGVKWSLMCDIDRHVLNSQT
jgi:hypothetical protein